MADWRLASAGAALPGAEGAPGAEVGGVASVRA